MNKIIENIDKAIANGLRKAKVTESIYSDDTVIVPMADVQHLEKQLLSGEPNGLFVITKNTKWNFENDIWENPIYIGERNADKFNKAWCTYRHELEYDTLDITE